MRDDRTHGEPATDHRRAPTDPARPFADREVAIVAEGEPAQQTEAWSRLAAAMVVRRRVTAPVALRERIMAAIRELPLA